MSYTKRTGGNKMCCVINCRNSNQTGHKMFNFPNRPHEKEMKEKWIRSIGRTNDDGTAWIPKSTAVVCSEHFVGNRPIKHPNSPAYIPTIFPMEKNKTLVQQHSRYKRYCNRNNIPESTVSSFKSISYPNESQLNDTMIYAKPITKCQGVQVEFDVNVTDMREFSFECTFYNNNCTSTSITTPYSFLLEQKTIVKKEFCDPIPEYFNSCLNKETFSGYESIKNENLLKNLTGSCYDVFNMLVSMLPNIDINENLNNNNKLLLFLMKLKLGITFLNLGDLFNIHQTTASKIFFNLLPILCRKTKPFIFWPSKDVILETLPYAFKKKYPNCRCIVQCTEIKVEKPPTIAKRLCMYSKYESVKCLVGITPNGAICFLSKCYEGQLSDQFITNASGFISRLEPGDQVLAGKGFSGFIKNDCESRNSILNTTPTLYNGRCSNEKNNKTYSEQSVQIEGFFARLKIYSVLNKIQLELLPHIDDIMYICCSITNLQSPEIEQ